MSVPQSKKELKRAEQRAYRIEKEIQRILKQKQEVQQREEVILRQVEEIKHLKDALRPRLGIIQKSLPPIPESQMLKNFDELSTAIDLVATFIPNERIRTIQNWQPDSLEVDELADFLRAKYHFALSLVHIAGGRETRLVDRNLRCVVKKLAKLFDGTCRAHVDVRKKPKANSWMATAVHEELGLFDKRTNVVLIGCEAKGSSASNRQCITQLIALCGNGAMEMRRHGVGIDDCVTLGIAVAETGIQFCAVYLMDSSFPMFLNLSPVLHPLHHAEEIATWMLRFVYGASLALNTLHAATEPIPNLHWQLNTASYFFKPVREGYKGVTSHREPRQHRSILPSRVDHILRIYDRLYEHHSRLDPRPANWSISFPVGWITVPSQATAFQKGLIAAIRFNDLFTSLTLVLRPCLVFPRVKIAKKPSEALTVWRDFKPPAHLIEPYLASWRSAVEFLNEAGVVHFDLRPCNVLWRSPRDGCVEVMLIDFDDALFCNQRIPRRFASDMRGDPRFPLSHMGRSRHPRACAEHNTFYVTQLERWLAHVGTASYDDFMLFPPESGNKKRKAETDVDEMSSPRHRRRKRGNDHFIARPKL